MAVNGFGVKIYDNANTGRRGQESHVAIALQVGGLFQFDEDTGRMGRGPRDVSRDMQFTAPNTIRNEHTYIDIMEPEDPKQHELPVPIASTAVIQRPAAGGKSGGTSADQLKDHVGSSDENDEDEDEDNPPLVIDKSKKSPFSQELAGLDRNLGSAWEAPPGCDERRRWTGHRRRRSSRLEIESPDVDRPVLAEALDCEWVLNFFVS